MKILWDLRLFSYNYKSRGVGLYTKSLCNDFLKKHNSQHIYILGNPKDIPIEISSKNITIISYKKSNWKSDLYSISKIVKKYKIDLLHYWIALGPIHQIGLGFKAPCKTVATIHDLAVENWQNIPYLKSKKRSWYWKLQKKLIMNVDSLIFNSEDTKINFIKTIKKFEGAFNVIYPKIDYNIKKYTEKKILITLGGSETKNLKQTIEAFKEFQIDYPQFTLLIHGNTDELNQSEFQDSSIRFVSYNEYLKNLSSSMALLSFSYYEGLGLPPIEAMSLGIPSAVSNIPSFKETLGDSAVYADPNSINEISNAIEEIVCKNDIYKQKVKKANTNYMKRTNNNGDLIQNIYKTLL